MNSVACRGLGAPRTRLHKVKGQLLGHLLRKAWRRVTEPAEAEATPTTVQR